MKKQFIFILFFSFIYSTFFAQQTTPKLAFLEKWENSKNYLIEIAEAMPENEYGYKPTERQRSFKEQLIHIKENMEWLSNSYIANNDYKREKTDIPNTKTEIITLLENAFDSVIEIVVNTPDVRLKETVDFFSGSKSKLQILNLLQDHVTHHRGQLIVYLNLKNIKPPPYIGW